MTLYSDRDLHFLTSPASPLMEGNRHYDVLLTGPAGWAHSYEVQAPNAKAAKTIAREHAVRISRIVDNPRVASCVRSETFVAEGF